MKLFKILLLFIFLSFSFLLKVSEPTGSYFRGQADSLDSQFSSGCWLAPTVPALISPANNSFTNTNSFIFDWSDSTTSCPLVSQINYQIEIYSDPGLGALVSGASSLAESKMVSPQTTDGDYYWRVRACDDFGNCSDWSPVDKFTIDTVDPNSEIKDLPSLSTSPNFTINYLAGDDNLDYVNLCYSWNLTAWVCPPELQDRSHSPGSFSFNSPRGDGNYYFATIAHDLAGNTEAKDLSANPLTILFFPSIVYDFRTSVLVHKPIVV